MQFNTVTSPHIFVGTSVPRIMRRVLYAMIPGIGALVWLFGWGVLLQIGIASVVAITAEAAMLAIRGRPVGRYLGDCSVLVTAWLLAVALPALSPWWLTALGVAFAVIVAKHLCGGLGHNLFNPAMAGYVVLLVFFPLQMSTWPSSDLELGFTDTAHIILWSQLPAGLSWDALSGATPLDGAKTQLSHGLSMKEILVSLALFGGIVGQGWEWVSLAFLAGGLWLVYTRTAAWQIPTAVLASLTASAGVFYALDLQAYALPWFYVFSFSAIYGAFFIATDPVSASTTPRGRLFYGAGIGILAYLTQSFGGYPYGMAFAVLLMNITASTIDAYTQPRVFGKR